jgi:hypothetical protein
MTLPTTIKTTDDVRTLVRWCAENIGLSYHPDTAAGDYEPPFDAETVDRLDRLHAEAFAVAGDEIYEMGVEEFERIAPQLFNG